MIRGFGNLQGMQQFCILLHQKNGPLRRSPGYATVWKLSGKFHFSFGFARVSEVRHIFAILLNIDKFGNVIATKNSEK